MTTTDTPKCRGKAAFDTFLTENMGKPELSGVFDRLTELYTRVNSQINISALRTQDDIYIKHYLDSVYPSEFFDGECCDVGCGGGFPAIPISIVTGLNVTGIDGVGKKLKLIELARSELSLKNLFGMHIRAEDLAKTGKLFDTVCARAVAAADKCLAYCAPLCRPGGKVILYRTQTDGRASDAVTKKYKVELIQIKDYVLPSTDINRRLFVYAKL